MACLRRSCGVMGLSLIAAEACLAGVLRVPEDYPSVLAAVDASTTGDSVLVGPGTWTDKDTRVVSIGGSLKTFTSCGFLKGGITLIGIAGVDVTVIDAQSSGIGFVVPFVFANYVGETVTLQDLTVTGGANGGSAILGDTSGQLVVRSCAVSDNASLGAARAIGLYRCDLLLEDSEVSFNVSTATAGVYAVDCDLQILRCRFEGNQGQAVELSTFPGNTDTVVIQDCEFIGNRMSVDGAAVGLVDPYSVQIERNLFLRNVNTSLMGAGLWVYDSFGTIRYNTFAYDSTRNGAAAGLLFAYFSGDVSNNTFVGCHADPASYGSAVYGGGAPGLNFSNNLFSDCTGAAAVAVYAPLPGSCNGFWNNEGGIGDYVPSVTDLFLDPIFCDVPNLDFTLDAHSPYAAGNVGCGQIGALGVGCGGVAVEAMTWGRIKTLYR
jgi:hypothetical protein